MFPALRQLLRMQSFNLGYLRGESPCIEEIPKAAVLIVRISKRPYSESNKSSPLPPNYSPLRAQSTGTNYGLWRCRTRNDDSVRLINHDLPIGPTICISRIHRSSCDAFPARSRRECITAHRRVSGGTSANLAPEFRESKS